MAVLRIRDVYPRSRILIFTHPRSRILDPGSKNRNQKEGWKKNFCRIFLCSHKFHKIENYFSFEVLTKKFWPLFQCCGSGMFIPDPDFYPSRISDPGSKNSNKGEGWKKICCHNFLCSHKFHKIANYFSFGLLKKKNFGQFSKNYRTFYSKNCHYALKNMGLGSGIRKKSIPDPGSRGQKGTGSRIRNTAIFKELPV